MIPLLEIACFSTEGAAIAARAGANRIELGEEYACGGISPTLSTFQDVRENCSIPIHLLIRVRAGNFQYEPFEIDTMEAQIKEFHHEGADGFVFGALNNRGEPDEYACKKLLDAADGKPSVFHRAFDAIPHPLKALEKLQLWGFFGLLTSGGNGNAYQHVDQLAELARNCHPDFQFIPGGGIRANHLSTLHLRIQAPVYHSAALVPATQLPDTTEIQLMLQCLSESSSSFSF